MQSSRDSRRELMNERTKGLSHTVYPDDSISIFIFPVSPSFSNTGEKNNSQVNFLFFFLAFPVPKPGGKENLFVSLKKEFLLFCQRGNFKKKIRGWQPFPFISHTAF